MLLNRSKSTSRTAAPHCGTRSQTLYTKLISMCLCHTCRPACEAYDGIMTFPPCEICCTQPPVAAQQLIVMKSRIFCHLRVVIICCLARLARNSCACSFCLSCFSLRCSRSCLARCVTRAADCLLVSCCWVSCCCCITSRLDLNCKQQNGQVAHTHMIACNDNLFGE